MKNKLSSEWIYKFYQELEKKGIENHGLLIMQGHDIVFEEYMYPYSADMPHTLFSVTKSLVSTATGFAIDEGLFSLDSKILPFFPEYKPCKSDEWDNVTIRSLLTMTSNKNFSFVQDMTGDYIDIFLKAPFRKKDRGFLYSNNDVHIVAAIIQRLTGMSLVDYLMPRLFEPLGIEKPFWETNSIGHCIGGNGAHLKVRDLAKICRCYADGGIYEGKQVIPEWWTKEATRTHVELHGRPNETGYGYFFWMYADIFHMYGMYGQIVAYYPRYDAVVVCLDSVIDDTTLSGLMRNVLTKAFENEPSEEWDEKLDAYLKTRGEKVIARRDLPHIPTYATYHITPASDAVAKILFPASIIPRSVSSSFAKRTKKNLDRVSFELTQDVLTVKWFEEEDEVIINCGLDGKPRVTDCCLKGYTYKLWAYAYGEDGKVQVVVKPINTLATQRITFEFSGDELSIKMNSTPSFSDFIKFNAGDQAIIKNHPRFEPAIMKGLGAALAKAEDAMIYKAK